MLRSKIMFLTKYLTLLFSSGRLGKLPVSLDEKIGFLANHMMEKKNLEKEIENLEDSILYVIFQY